MHNEYKVLVDNIKYYRKLKNITQEQLAELSDLSVSYIKQIEANNEFKNITLNTLSKIAKSLDVNLNQLFSEKVKVIQ